MVVEVSTSVVFPASVKTAIVKLGQKLGLFIFILLYIYLPISNLPFTIKMIVRVVSNQRSTNGPKSDPSKASKLQSFKKARSSFSTSPS